MVLIVHIKRGSELDHVICVESSQRHIFDSAELFPYHLTVESFKRSCGVHDTRGWIYATLMLKISSLSMN